jgi:cytochrome c551
MRAPPVIAATLAALVLLAACGTTGEDDTTEAEESSVPTGEATAAAEPDQPPSAQEERGRELFAETCGSCHTLEAAGTEGQIGPNLDEAQVDREQVLRAIEIGGAGSGNMPPNLLQGKDAEDVATFVAESNPAPG